MFKVFTLWHGNIDDYGNPIDAPEVGARQKVCVNLDEVQIVQQSGRYQQIPIGGEPGDNAAVARAAFAPPARPQRRNRQQEVFIIDADRFILHLKSGSNWHVMGSFDEFCDVLTNFRNQVETL